MAVVPIIPNVLPSTWAANGDKATIPSDAQSTGRASFSEGFSPKTSLPETDGGVPPARTDFNGIFNILTEYAIWTRQGGGCTWSSGMNFVPPCLVHGSDGNVYKCVTASGPDMIGVGAKDPIVAGNEAYWLNLSALFTRATSTSAGKIGLVPAPKAGDQDKYLKGDGTWSEVEPSGSGNAPIIMQGVITTSWIGNSAPYTQTISVANVTNVSIVEISLPSTATSEQVAAYQALNWTDGGQASGSIVLKAWGITNSIAIPITIVVH